MLHLESFPYNHTKHLVTLSKLICVISFVSVTWSFSGEDAKAACKTAVPVPK